MDYANFRKIVSFLLAVIMIAAVFVVPFSVSADEGTDTDTEAVTAVPAEEPADTDITLAAPATDDATETADRDYTASYDAETLQKLLNAPSYNAYMEEHKKAGCPDHNVMVTAADLNTELTTAETSIIDASEIITTNRITGEQTVAEGVYGPAPTGDVVVTGDTGETVFNVTVPETGKYSMRVTYTSNASLLEKDQGDTSSEIPTTIERMIYIDDELPFTEARYFYFPRVWEYEYETDENGEYITDNKYVEGYNGQVLTFPKDKNGNDTRPRRWEVAKWQTYYVRDWLGYEIDPLQFYFTEGQHTITFVSNREAMVIASIELYKYEEEPLYEDWLADLKAQGVKEITGVTPTKIQVENPKYISVQNVIPGYDRTSSLSEPQDPARIKYNFIENGTVNNWMLYEVEVPEDGLYSMSFRFRQNTLIGLFTSRRVKINGEVQFREASYLRFKYDTVFQTTYANDGEQTFNFYLKKGVNQIELEVVIGKMSEFVYDIEQTIEDLNVAYQTMLMITGPVPDQYRDYNFGRLCPDEIDTIAKAADLLYEVTDTINEMAGEASDQAKALENFADLFAKMAKNEYEIAPNFITFKNFIVELSNWLYQMLAQPVKLDYIIIGGTDEPLPKPTPSSFQRMGFEIKAFFASFTMDYTTVGFSDDAATAQNDVIEMWSISDRETMLIIRYIVDNYFTPQSNISLRIKVITAGLTEALLAGIGPDVSFMPSLDTITWGMRTALLPLEGFDGFEELTTEFSPAVIDKLTMIGQDNIKHTYGLPNTIVFPMAFYRVDVLSELGIAIPETWDDLYSVMQTLGNNNLEVGMPVGLEGTELFLYQLEGGDIWADDGYRTGLDTNTALTAFQAATEMFTKYSSPYAYEISRFRTGEIPIMIAPDAVTTYNQLMGFFELRGLWKMAPVIGTVQKDEDGNPKLDENGNPIINKNSVIASTTQAMVIPRGGYNPEVVWQFVKWYCGEDSQTRQARETVAVSAPTTKYPTANLGALLSQKWTPEERAAVKEQVEHLVGPREYPGAYIFTQKVPFAFNTAINTGVDPAEAMLDQILDINKEITRKRIEFGLDANEIAYGFTVDENGNVETSAADGN